VLGMPSGYLRFLLSFSRCLMGRSAVHQLNARSAQTGKADKLMERSADHGPTGWDALRTMHHIALFSHSRSAYWGEPVSFIMGRSYGSHIIVDFRSSS